jgi:hypothetical protein
MAADPGSELVLTKHYRCIVVDDGGVYATTLVDEGVDYASSTTMTWRDDVLYTEDNDKEKVKADKRDKKLKLNKKTTQLTEKI